MRSSVRQRLYPEGKRDKFEINPAFEPNDGYLRHVQEESTKRRAAWQRTWNRVMELIPAWEASAIRACGTTLARFHNPKTGMDILVPRLCHGYYCPTCPPQMHWTRTTYHARKIASLDPSEEKPTPKVVNLVFTLPPTLHQWVRDDPRVAPAWRKAVMRTIAQAYAYEGRRGYPVERVAFNELGAIINFHAIGDEASPWPKWAPHLDIIMPAWKRVDDKIEPLRSTWPERFAATNQRYQDNVRDILLPLAKTPTPRLETVEFLKADFETVWHVSRPPKTRSNPDRKGIIHVESAMHRIRYSCRPLFVLQNARISTSGSGESMIYRIEHGRRSRPIIHRVPLGPALGQLESIREWMHGRRARAQVGILSKRTYDAVARLAGHEPVRERINRGLVHRATYELTPDNTYTKSARNAPSPASPDDDDE